MKMHLLSGGRLRMSRRGYYPDAQPGEPLDLPVSCTLLKHPQGNALFDTGCSPRSLDETEAYWGRFQRVMRPIHEAPDLVIDQLPKAGLTAEDIDIVVCSHLHTDHCGCNSFFKRATVICTNTELEAARAGGGAYLAEDWDLGQTFETFDREFDVFGDGKFTLIETPGHTAGMAIGVVVLDRHAFVLASDAAPVAEVLEQRYAPKGTWDVDKSITALDEIARLQADGATVLFGHDDAQWRGLLTGEAYYD
jgi:N-acyl homoserine lactone hydrolase